MRQRILSLSAAWLLVGCASGPAGIAPGSDVDYARMNAIERAAAHNGVQVIWITPPRKTQKKDGG
jgi:hypothetical protein